MPHPEFTTRFRRELPGDPAADPRPRQVPGALWSPATATPVATPRLLAWSRPLAAELGLAAAVMDDPGTARVLAGNGSWPGMAPFAANYGGHQFGNWAGQLGDGRALVLGELRRPDGELVEMQLKGAGPTPYSRRGDGRAVLRSSIREFLCSEAMHWLGVPTTRALSLVDTGDEVLRDMFYDGNAQQEPGAIVCRIAPTFLRFGSYELPTSRGEMGLLRQLAEFTLRHFFADLGPPSAAAFAAMYREVAKRTAVLIAHWQAVGFVHGVMNTDNMSILGLTIDYGPYGWLDDFDPAFTPNTTDHGQRRYCFGNQPAIGLWNVERLGVALSPLFAADSVIEEGAEEYRRTYVAESTARFCGKIGIAFDQRHDDAALLQDLFAWLAAAPIDMTLFFRALADVVVAPAPPTSMPEASGQAFYGEVAASHAETGLAWLQRWWRRTRAEPAAPAELAAGMNRVNPAFVLRNWLAQQAIDAAHEGDLAPLHALLDRLERPFTVPPEGMIAQKRPEWARNRAGCGALS
ncbi:MAG: YdiU family protein [Planctomycetes bacterium]|nr:YdiU family protein [Planctomycetota bacterium]